MKNLPCHLVMIMKVNLQHAERKMGIRMVFAHVICLHCQIYMF